MKKKTLMIVPVAALLFALVSVSNAAITITGAVSDDGGGYDSSDPWIIGGWGDLIVGDGGAGSLTIDAGSEVHSTYSVISDAGGVGEVTVTGAGSVWYGEEGLWTSGIDLATLNILDNGMFKTDNSANHFIIGQNAEVLMTTGGQLAILGASTTSLADFLTVNTGYDNNLKYWNGSVWDRMSNGTAGTDYTLTAGTGDLDGYGVLTAIAPVTGGTPGTVIMVK